MRFIYKEIFDCEHIVYIPPGWIVHHNCNISEWKLYPNNDAAAITIRQQELEFEAFMNMAARWKQRQAQHPVPVNEHNGQNIGKNYNHVNWWKV